MVPPWMQWVLHPLKSGSGCNAPVGRAAFGALSRGPVICQYVKPWITKGLCLDGAAIPKISKRHFFQDIWFSCQWVTGMGLKPRQNFFCKNISKIVGARPHQNFGLLKGVAAVSVVSWSKFFAQFIQGMWLTTGENFSQISQRVFGLWLILF